MIPVMQTHTPGYGSWEAVRESGQVPGNCVQASLASLLELPLDLVPHIAVFENNWGGALRLWMETRGKRMRVYSDDENTREYFEYWGIEHHPLNMAPSGQMMIATGPSHSGPWSHVVVWKAGELVHDPHPSQRGIAGPPTEFWQVTDA